MELQQLFSHQNILMHCSRIYMKGLLSRPLPFYAEEEQENKIIVPNMYYNLGLLSHTVGTCHCTSLKDKYIVLW